MSAPPRCPPTLDADWFDGSSARAHRVRLRIERGELVICGSGTPLRVPLHDVLWPERRRRGARVAHLRQGGSLHCEDGVAFDSFARDAGIGESWVVRGQQSWRATGIALLVVLLLASLAYGWGVPLAARGVLELVPPTFDRVIGEAALETLSSRWLGPSALPVEQQERLRVAFARAVALAYPEQRPQYRLLLRRSPLGPNAFAVPGGTIVLTDELVVLLDRRDDVIVGVLAHELAHVRNRHAMRTLVQLALLGSITSVAFGDFSVLLAGAPALLGQMAYSRDFEREADRESVAVLRAAGISPAVMVTLFDRLQQWRAAQGRADPALTIGIALASHPADEERIRYFRDAAQQ